MSTPDIQLSQSDPASPDELHGDVIRPWDADYDRARALFNGAYDRRPQVIVRPHNADDVAAALRHAHANGLPVAVRGGGHHVAAFGSVDDGLTIDLSLLRGVSVDPERRVARVEGEAAMPINDLFGPASYLALQSVDVPSGRRTWETSAFLGKLSDNTLDALVAHAAAASLEAPRIGLLPLNGAVAHVPPGATAFGGRGAEWLVSAGATWDSGSEDAAARGWADRLHRAVASDSTGIGYANMVGDRRPVYPAWTQARLRSVKAQWDPANVFRSNHNVLPLGS